MQTPGVCELTSEPDALSFSLGSISSNRSKHFDKVKELLRTNPELAGRIETELWENIDKLYDRKKATKSKAKVTEVDEPEKDEEAEEKKPKKAVKIDAMVDD